MKRIILVFTFVIELMPLISFGQQGNIWYFGDNAGLDFSSGSAVAIKNDSFNTTEGCATICDRKGKLLFYTDGVTVRNKNHFIMQNGSGLFGHHSSTNSAIIVPKPGDSTHYFIFTCDAVEDSCAKGYRFSEVDMSLNNGLGAVINKNVLLYARCTEHLTAVKNANGVDYWVITKEWGNHRFRVYKIGCNGVNLSPVITDIGTDLISSNVSMAFGALKVSPDGKKLGALTNYGANANAQLFDFDNNSGQIKNLVNLAGFDSIYSYSLGVEFSPNSKILYITTVDSLIYQYDITSAIPALINASKVNIKTNFYSFALQLGPDKKIYIADLTSLHVSVINDPDVYGTGCNYIPAAVLLNDVFCEVGLPAFVSSIFNDARYQIDFTYAFINCFIQFSGTSNLTGRLKWYWDFGDGEKDSSQVINHSYKRTGDYIVTLTVHSADSCGAVDSFLISKRVSIQNVFGIDFRDTGNCLNDFCKFYDGTQLTIGNITGWNWDFGDGASSIQQNPVHQFGNAGIYYVKFVVSTDGICPVVCESADSIIKPVYVDSKPVAGFKWNNGCVNEAVQFTDASYNTSGTINQWQWNFGDAITDTIKNPSHAYTNPGSYTSELIVTSKHGCPHSTNETIIIEDNPVADFLFTKSCITQPSVFTDNSKISFGTITKWQWDFGDGSSSTIQSPAHIFTSGGNFVVTLNAQSEYGCVSASKMIRVLIPKVNVDAGRDTFAIFGVPLQLMGSGAGSYQWIPSTGLNNAYIPNPVAILQNDINYTLKLTDTAGCIGYDTINIKVHKIFDIYVPTAFTPNNDRKNDVLRPVGYGIQKLEFFSVYNRLGEKVFTTFELEKGWDGKINGTNQPLGTYVWILKATDIFGKAISKKGTSVLIR